MAVIAALVAVVGVAVAVLKRDSTSAASGTSSCVDAANDARALNAGPPRDDLASVDLERVEVDLVSGRVSITVHLGGDVHPQMTSDDAATTDVMVTAHYTDKAFYGIELRPGPASPFELNLIDNDPTAAKHPDFITSSGTLKVNGSTMVADIPQSDLPRLDTKSWWYVDSTTQYPDPSPLGTGHLGYGDFCGSLEAPARF